MKKRLYGRKQKHSYGVRVGACADYLVGVPIKVIEQKWALHICMVIYWIRRTGNFKTRRECR